MQKNTRKTWVKAVVCLLSKRKAVFAFAVRVLHVVAAVLARSAVETHLCEITALLLGAVAS